MLASQHIDTQRKTKTIRKFDKLLIRLENSESELTSEVSSSAPTSYEVAYEHLKSPGTPVTFKDMAVVE